MKEIARRRFLKQVSLLPMISPAIMIENVSKNNNGIISNTGWVRRARRNIPATKDLFFQTAGIGPSPKSVMKEVANYLELQNRGPVNPEVYDIVGQIESDLRKKLADTFGAEEDEVTLTHSTSEGINIASWAINWEKGDEVLITNQEHPANTIPWYSLSERFGIKIKRLNFNSDVDIVAQIEKSITNKVKMVSIPHVSRNNGRALTLDESKIIASLLKPKNIRYHLDGAQGPLCVPLNFHELECDYYSTCGHKWILGPKGTGAFFCRKSMLDSTWLTWTGSHSHTTMDQYGNFELIPAARRFEFGTRALATFAGFNEAIKWNESIGINKILKRIDSLVIYAIEEWTSRGYKVASPTSEDKRSGILVVTLPKGVNGWEIYDHLRLNKSAFTSPVDSPKDLRIALHFFNTKDEIRRVFDFIERFSN